MKRSTDIQLGQLDEAIVKGIESIGRYHLWGWEATDFCETNLIFEDDESSSCRLGMTITIYPVNKEEDE